MTAYQVALGAEDTKKVSSLDTAKAEQALDIERKVWLHIPSTIEFLQTLNKEKSILEQCARDLALKGEFDKCGRTMIEVAALEKTINTIKHGRYTLTIN